MYRGLTEVLRMECPIAPGSTRVARKPAPLLFDLLTNVLMRLLDSTGISHRVRGVPDWNHQAFADDLSRYVGANTLLDIVSAFKEWSGLKISVKKSLATGTLYGRGETQRQKKA